MSDTPTCASIELRLPAYLAGDLPEAERAEIQAHLAGCAACRELADSLHLLSGALAMTPLTETLDPARRIQIQRAFRQRAERPTAGQRWAAFLEFLNPARSPTPALRFAVAIVVFVAVPLLMMKLLLPASLKDRERGQYEMTAKLPSAVMPQSPPPVLVGESMDYEGDVGEGAEAVTVSELPPAPEDADAAAPEPPALFGRQAEGQEKDRRVAATRSPAPRAAREIAQAERGNLAVKELPIDSVAMEDVVDYKKDATVDSYSFGDVVTVAPAKPAAPARARESALSERSGLKTGSGSLTLSGENTYVGATVVNGGTLLNGREKTRPQSGVALAKGDTDGVASKLEENVKTAGGKDARMSGVGDRGEDVVGHATRGWDRKYEVASAKPASSAPAAASTRGWAEGHSLGLDEAKANKPAEFAFFNGNGNISGSTALRAPVAPAQAEPADKEKQMAAQPDAKMVPLVIELPKPMFVGTPVPFNFANAKNREGTAETAPKPSGTVGCLVNSGSGTLVAADKVPLLGDAPVADQLIKNAEKEATEAKPEPARPAPPRQPAGFNPYIEAKADAFSTFSIDVDTASYTLTRRALSDGRLPDPEEVRTEEIVNAFDYDYSPPAAGAFAMDAQLAPSPFRAPLELLKIGVQGRALGRDAKKAAALTLVIDASGSMDTPDRLGRIRRALRLLVDQLRPTDSVALVAFNDNARLLLDRTAAANKESIVAAIDGLTGSGSTQLEGGLQLAYEVAARGFVSGGANRVILMSDGVANLGAATAAEILQRIEQYRKQGIYLTVLGFGSGNYDDAMLLQLADKGDGMYAYVDSDEEAKRLLVDQWEQTLHVIAKDVKIQVEFNPERVRRWRQIGYEKRHLNKEDFRNDKVDAGEVGSGQAVTALYDVELVESANVAPLTERGHTPTPDALTSALQSIGTVRVRYQDPDTGRVTELEQRITAAQRLDEFLKASPRFRVAACAGEFAELLRASPYTAGSDFAAVAAALRPAALELPLDQRVQELLRLVEAARGLAQ